MKCSKEDMIYFKMLFLPWEEVSTLRAYNTIKGRFFFVKNSILKIISLLINTVYQIVNYLK